jgi:hypothetical protein
MHNCVSQPRTLQARSCALTSLPIRCLAGVHVHHDPVNDLLLRSEAAMKEHKYMSQESRQLDSNNTHDAHTFCLPRASHESDLLGQLARQSMREHSARRLGCGCLPSTVHGIGGRWQIWGTSAHLRTVYHHSRAIHEHGPWSVQSTINADQETQTTTRNHQPTIEQRPTIAQLVATHYLAHTEQNIALVGCWVGRRLLELCIC